MTSGADAEIPRSYGLLKKFLFAYLPSTVLATSIAFCIASTRWLGWILAVIWMTQIVFTNLIILWIRFDDEFRLNVFLMTVLSILITPVGFPLMYSLQRELMHFMHGKPNFHKYLEEHPLKECSMVREYMVQRHFADGVANSASASADFVCGETQAKMHCTWWFSYRQDTQVWHGSYHTCEDRWPS